MPALRPWPGLTVLFERRPVGGRAAARAFFGVAFARLQIPFDRHALFFRGF
jgi:hypothetical protein